MAKLLDRLDPRKRATGTSYEASGQTPPPKVGDTEVGSARSIKFRDPVPQFQSKQQELKTYHEMASTNSACRAALRAVKSTVLGAEFYIDPFGDDQEYLDEAEFASFNIFEGQTTPFLWNQSRILKMLDYGFHVAEPVWELREWGPRRARANRKKYTMLRKLAPRYAPTIKEIEYDSTGGPEAIVQNVIDKNGKVTEKTIDIGKAIIFTFDEDDGDMMGLSILRSAHEHWFYQKHMWKMDAIQKERHGIGIPDIELPAGYDAADKEAAHKLGRNLRTNEWAHIVRPPGLNVSFAKVEGQLVNILSSVDHHTLMIFLSVLGEFLLAGATEGGARATAATQQDIFMKSNKWVANLICDIFNSYVIPPLIGYNFDTDEFPKMKVRNIGETRDLQQWASALANVTAQRVIDPDDDLEAYARRVFDAPKKTSRGHRIPGRELVTDSLDTPNASDNGGNGGGPSKGSTPNTNRSGNMGKGNNVT